MSNDAPTSPKPFDAQRRYEFLDREPWARREAMRILREHTTSSAFFDSPGRSRSARCLSGTRKSFLSSIEEWSMDRSKQVCIVKGAAGSGKSAILQSAAEQLKEKGVPFASFFWNTALGHRASDVVPTLAYQIATFSEPTRRWITKAVGLERLTPYPYHAALRYLFEPMVEVSTQHQIEPIILILDGLDECHLDQEPPTAVLTRWDQEQACRTWHLLTCIAEAIFLNRLRNPFKVLISLGAPSSLENDFMVYPNGTTVLSLDATAESESDVQLYVGHQLAHIRGKHKLSSTWPSTETINELIRRSCGGFGYPALAMQYIAGSPADPTTRLDSILTTKTARKVTKNARSFIDALYLNILHSVPAESWPVLTKILELLMVEKLKYRLFTDLKNRFTVAFVARYLFLTPQEVYDQVRILQPILSASMEDHPTMEDCPIPVVDPSFRAFLTDRSRSGDFFINHADAHIHIQLVRLKHGSIQALLPDEGKSAWYTPDGFANSLRRELFVPPPGVLYRPPPFPPSRDLAEGLLCFTSPNDDTFLDFAREQGIDASGSKVNRTIVSHFIGIGEEEPERTSEFIGTYYETSVCRAEDKKTLGPTDVNSKQRWRGIKLKARALAATLA